MTTASAAPSRWTERQPAAGAPQCLEVDLVRPLIGFPESRRFVLRPLGPAFEPYAAMSSLEEPGLEFVVVPPGALFPDYVIELPSDDVQALGLRQADDAVVLVLVTRRDRPVPTVNLMGPVVVNRRTRRALQVVLESAGYGSAVPVNSGTARPADQQLLPAIGPEVAGSDHRTIVVSTAGGS